MVKFRIVIIFLSKRNIQREWFDQDDEQCLKLNSILVTISQWVNQDELGNKSFSFRILNSMRWMVIRSGTKSNDDETIKENDSLHQIN